jgi:hypothetical protein
MALKIASGKLTLLRVHDVGQKFGAPRDEIDVEVVIQLDREGNKAFGFQLRNDSNRVVRQGMLDLLRDTFINNYTVAIDYDEMPGRTTFILKRVYLIRQVT